MLIQQLSKSPLNRQHGAALLLIIMVLFTSASSFILASANYNNPRLQQRAEVRQELARAKEMLLYYAMSYPEISGSSDGPGRLPCPDVDNDGFPDASCSTDLDSFQGRLPLSLDPAGGTMLSFSDDFSDLDQQIWYAVDPNYHSSTLAALNFSNTGAFSVDGQSDYVAVLIAPGEEVSGQDRFTSTLDDSNYLEGGNQNGTTYVSSYDADPENFNDQVLGITRKELMTLSVNRVMMEIRDWLDIFHEAGNRYYRLITDAQDFSSNNCSSWFYDYVFPTHVYLGYYNNQCNWATEDASFDNAMSGALSWYSADSWDSVITYTGGVDTATVTFADCGITFTLNFNDSLGRSTISRSQPSC